METEHSLRQRIGTVGDLRAIVRTMKALAAVNGRQFEAALRALDAYAQTVDMGLQAALQGHAFPKPGRKAPVTRLAAVIFGSDVGLCGAFNEDLTAYALDKMNGFQIPITERRVLAVGARVAMRLNELRHPVEATLTAPGSPSGIGATVGLALEKLEQWQAQAIEQVLLFYSQAGTPFMLHLLPVDLRQFSRLAREPWPSRVPPTYSLDAERLLSALLREHLFIRMFHALAASSASENQMRLRVMQAAEKNIQEKLDELVFVFRQHRQDAIDAELLDIMTGFETIVGER